MATRRPNRKKDDEAESREKVTPGRVPAFVRGALYRKSIRLELRHLNESSPMGQRVRSWNVGQGSEDEETSAETLAHMILTCSQEEAEALGGFQRYAICAFDADETKTYNSRCIFEVHSDGGTAEDMGPTEESTPKGIQAQMMRHNEALLRITLNSLGEMQGHSHSIIQSLQKRNELLEKRELEVVELRESLFDGEHGRRIEEMREMRIEKIQGAAFEKLAGYAPILLSRLLTKGEKGAKPPKILGEEIVKDLLAEVAGDQSKLAQIAGILGPVGTSKVAELVRMYSDEEESAAKQLASKNNAGKGAS